MRLSLTLLCSFGAAAVAISKGCTPSFPDGRCCSLTFDIFDSEGCNTPFDFPNNPAEAKCKGFQRAKCCRNNGKTAAACTTPEDYKLFDQGCNSVRPLAGCVSPETGLYRRAVLKEGVNRCSKNYKSTCCKGFKPIPNADLSDPNIPLIGLDCSKV